MELGFQINTDNLNIVKEISGSVWVIQTIEKEIVLILENENKIWKKQWQWSVMMETKESNEDFLECLYRWLYEELRLWKCDIIEIIDDNKFEFLFVKNWNWWIRCNLKLFKVIVDKSSLNFSLFNFEIWWIRLLSFEDFVYELLDNKDNLDSYLSRNWRPWAIEAILLLEREDFNFDRVFIDNWVYFSDSVKNLKKFINKLKK